MTASGALGSPISAGAERRGPMRYAFAGGHVEMMFDCWAGVQLDWAAGRGAPMDFAMREHGLNLTFLGQERSRSRVGHGETVEQPLAQGAVVLTIGEERSWVENPAAFEGLNICLDPRRLAAYAERNGVLIPDLRPVSFENDPRLHDIGRLIVDELRRGGGGDLYRDSLINLAMAHLVATYGERPEGEQRGRLSGARLKAVRDYVEENLSGCLTLDVLASKAAMSTFHFARSFKAATGVSPHRYVVTRRMDRAMRLVQETGLLMAEIAWRVGYADPSHFIAAFRRVHGATPGDVRAERR